MGSGREKKERGDTETEKGMDDAHTETKWRAVVGRKKEKKFPAFYWP